MHILHLLGYRMVEETDERVVMEMDNRPDLTNVRGALQGGLVATLIDIAGGILAGRNVGADQDVTTADLTIHYVAPVVEGPARAEATIVRAGKRLIVTAVDLYDVARDRLAARATLSFAVLDKR
ncbi:PaaI family thioesterase [Mycolicibacterium confluentis]|nr:PaaI family thioesterase [Mycolicibacterium confluentis]